MHIRFLQLGRFLPLIGIGFSLATPVAASGQHLRAIWGPFVCSDVIAKASTSPSDRVAISQLGGCGKEGGAAWAKAFRTAASTGDTTLITAFQYGALTLRDANILAATLDVMQRPEVSPYFRMEAIELAFAQVNTQRREVIFHVFNPAVENGDCIAEIPPHSHKPLVGTPLPSDTRRQVAIALDVVRNDPDAPPGLWSAAHCVRGYLGKVVPPKDRLALSVSYVCDNIFKVKNSGRFDLIVEFLTTSDTTQRTAATVNRNDTASLWGPEGGPFDLYVNGQKVAHVPNGGTSCQ